MIDVTVNSLGSFHMVWYGMVEVCEGAPVAVSGWVLTLYGMVWYGRCL